MENFFIWIGLLFLFYICIVVAVGYFTSMPEGDRNWPPAPPPLRDLKIKEDEGEG